MPRKLGRNGKASTQNSMPVKRKVPGIANEQYEVNVPGDGSCLFYSVAFSYLLPVINDQKTFRERFVQLFGDEAKGLAEDNRDKLFAYDGNVDFMSEHQVGLKALVNENFRKRLVAFMEQNQEGLRGFIPENEVFEHRMHRMGNANQKAWGDQPEIEAMSRFLQVNIQVWRDEDGTLRKDRGANHGSGHENRINLVYASRNHYHYLIDKLPKPPKCKANEGLFSQLDSDDFEPSSEGFLGVIETALHYFSIIITEVFKAFGSMQPQAGKEDAAGSPLGKRFGNVAGIFDSQSSGNASSSKVDQSSSRRPNVKQSDRSANRSGLSAKVQDGDAIVVDRNNVDKDGAILVNMDEGGVQKNGLR